jgi:hypothetical protein
LFFEIHDFFLALKLGGGKLLWHIKKRCTYDYYLPIYKTS